MRINLVEKIRNFQIMAKDFFAHAQLREKLEKQLKAVSEYLKHELMNY